MQLKVLTVLIILFYPFLGFTQSYSLAGGIRVGTNLGISMNVRLAKYHSLEGFMQTSISNKRATVALLYKNHKPLLSKRLNIFLGGGPHVSFNTKDKDKRNDEPAAYFGVSPIFGAEFTIRRLNISWDYKPQIDLTGGETKIGFDNQTSITLRYVFIKQKRKKINWKFWENWEMFKEKD